MDITWDAGHIDDSHEYAKTYRTDFLFLEPEKFLCTHFPTDSKWQLLDRPVGKQEFLDLPYLRGEFFGYGLELAGPATQVSQAGDSASLDLLAPQDVLLMAQLADPHDGEQTRRTFIRRIQGAARVDALFPESGQWKLRLFARTSSDPEPNRYTWVADLGYEAAAGTDSRFPETFGTYGQIGCNLIEPQFSPLPVGEPLRFSVDVPGVAGVAVVQGEAWTKLQRTTGDNWTGTATSSSSQPLKVLVQLRADDSQWQGILQYE
ncbi:MAG: hypothetical protein FJ109_14340 [Deltaproteobacteria bacterium]|nr:hypothetical protein [Deltaproteobacteria bacterium]